jgi:hypothetical protein
MDTDGFHSVAWTNYVHADELGGKVLAEFVIEITTLSPELFGRNTLESNKKGSTRMVWRRLPDIEKELNIKSLRAWR